jgi:NADH-quinone oxidoreductase subunit D
MRFRDEIEIMAIQSTSEQISGDAYTVRFEQGKREDTLILNMGPQHPSTHGVLRIILELDGEYIVRAEPVLGYLHRMHEAMAENRTFLQYMPNMGRVDYLHALAWNWAYVGAVERLAAIEIPRRAEYIRVITCELNRISSHLLWWGAYLLDLGAFTPIMYAFDDRERILDMIQSVSGSRLTYSFYRPGGAAFDLPPSFLDEVKAFIPHMRDRLPMYKTLVTDNIILRKRCEEVGVLPLEMCCRYGATGPVLRGSGQAYDVRRAEPYGVYPELSFGIPNQTDGDAMSRYLVRLAEIEESLHILDQAVNTIPDGDFLAKGAPKARWKAPAGEVYFAVEGARGKIGVHLFSDGTNSPYRCKLRAPGYSNLNCFAEMARGTLLSDAVSILGSLDLVIPEIDR